MHAGTALNWFLLLFGGALLVHSLALLVSRPGTQRSRTLIGRCWLALFVLVELVPRLAGWPAGTVLALSVLAFVPLLLAVRALRAR